MKIRKDLLLIHIILVTLIVTVWGIWILKQRADLKSIEREIRHREQLQKASELPHAVDAQRASVSPIVSPASSATSPSSEEAPTLPPTITEHIDWHPIQDSAIEQLPEDMKQAYESFQNEGEFFLSSLDEEGLAKVETQLDIMLEESIETIVSSLEEDEREAVARRMRQSEIADPWKAAMRIQAANRVRIQRSLDRRREELNKRANATKTVLEVFEAEQRENRDLEGLLRAIE